MHPVLGCSAPSDPESVLGVRLGDGAPTRRRGSSACPHRMDFGFHPFSRAFVVTETKSRAYLDSSEAVPLVSERIVVVVFSHA